MSDLICSSVIDGFMQAVDAVEALNAILPSQTGNSGKILVTNGSLPSWTFELGPITPRSVVSSGVVSATEKVTVNSGGSLASLELMNGANNGSTLLQTAATGGQLWSVTFPDSSGTVAFLDSPGFTGNPTAPTQSAGDNSTSLATTAYADNASSPATFQTRSAADPHDGTFSALSVTNGSATTTISLNGFITHNGDIFLYPNGGNNAASVYGDILTLGTSQDLRLVRDAANTIAQRSGANGQTRILSRTYTDGSNYSQFKEAATGGAVSFSIDELGTGIGTLNSFAFNKAVSATSFTGIGAAISGSFSATGTATTAFVITIGVTMANNTYEVSWTATSLVAAAVFYVSAKSTTTFTITYLAGLTGAVTGDYEVFP